MSTNKRPPSGVWRERMGAAFYACMVALVSLPASAAIDIPNDPLTTGARVAPNVLFILDDSGSMAFDGMPMDSISNANNANGWQHRSYVHNTIYYNPEKTYEPWVNADGTRMTGGTSYHAVYASFNQVDSGTIDLADTSSCRRFNRNSSATADEMTSGGTEVCGGVQTFYVPINPAGNLDVPENYYRYQILTDGRIVRSRWLNRTGSGPNYNNGISNAGCPQNHARQSTSTTGAAWRDCQLATPTDRSVAAELENYATWFSYHRTRMKAAKAGASAAFSELGGDVRVGFRTIWQRNGANTSGNWPRQDVPIPVGHNDGRFEDVTIGGTYYDNRTKWYERLQNSIGYNGTPLHGALHQAGRYFSSSEATGPYGPQAGADQLACRQNFTILTTDGYWNNQTESYPSGERVGNADGTSGPMITEPSTGASYQYVPGPPYRDSNGGSDGTLADVAMQYWKNDLRPDMRNIVPTTSANPAFWQHMVTFGLSIGLKGSTGFGSVEEVPANYTGWPDPMPAENATRIDDLLHAAVNSRGAFVAASDPDEFTAGLQAALAAIVERTGSFSNVSANSTSLDTDTRVFQASYVSGVWSGRLAANAIVDGKVSSTPTWISSVPTTNRRVFTSAGAFPENATSGQLAALTRGGAPSNYPVSGEDNAAYIAGNRSQEAANGGTLRNRSSLLGDIVGSSPAYVEDTNTLYVGANDGMLHAFDADTGSEVFGFIPSGIDWAALGTLSRPDYAHRYFVDGPVVVSTRSQTPGRNILVATLGKGGKGLFALDVTHPNVFNQADVKWQRYSTGGAPSNDNMGYIQSAPVLAKVRGADGAPVTAVLVANGINSTTERAVLLVYDLESGNLIRQIDTGVGSPANSNGLSGVVGWDQDGDGMVDTAYAGDLHGNVWKFDLSGTPTSWGVANSGDPLFTARDGDGNVQPITARLTVGLHPANFSTWVFFGTGRFMTIGDVEDDSVQSLYGIRDSGATVQRSSLAQRTTTVVGTRNGLPVRAFEQHGPLPPTAEGWYIDLLEPPNQEALGERVVSEVQVLNEALVVASIIPMSDACQSDGRGYLNALDAYTGTSLSGGSFFDLDGDGDFADETVGEGSDAPPVGSVDLGVGMPTLPNLLRELAAVGGSTGEIGEAPIRDDRYTGRVSWREEEGN